MKRPANKNLPAAFARSYLEDVVAIQSEMLRRLSRKKALDLPEMGSLMEDIGNRYLDIAETIRQHILSGGAAAPARPAASGDETSEAPGHAKARRG